MKTPACTLRYRSAALGLAFAGVLLSIFLVPAPGLAASIIVDTYDDELNVDGDCSLREAIQAANTDSSVDNCGAGSGADMIALDVGTYTLSLAGSGEDGNQSGDLDIVDDLTITGLAMVDTGVDGLQQDRVFDVHAGTVFLSDLSVRNGFISFPGDGGNVRNRARLRLTNVGVGGGDASTGGGIFNDQGGDVGIVGSVISGNSSENGGGLANAASTEATVVTIKETTFFDNTAQRGGGIHSTGSLVVETSTFTRNGADEGGGLYNGGMSTVVNSTISTNTASVSGGGIRNGFEGTLALKSATLSQNSAPVGGGLHTDSGLTTLENTIVSDSVGSPDCNGAVTSHGFNLIEDPSGCGIGGDTTGNITEVDPQLGPLDENDGLTQTHLPSIDSPVVDAGSPSCPPPDTDQRGLARPQGPRCDIGAVETTAADLAVTKTAPPGRAPTGRELTYTITVVNNGPTEAVLAKLVDAPPSNVTVERVNGVEVCVTDGRLLECGLGTLASGATVIIEIVVKPTQPGVITNTASVSSPTPDPDGGNNADSEDTTVCRITSRRSSPPCP
jgi:CSLREA domain-containing protein/uncharacterized repeat protein (TIGR01451 family)